MDIDLPNQAAERLIAECIRSWNRGSEWRQDPHALPQEVDILGLLRLVNQLLHGHRGLDHREPPRSGSWFVRVEDVAVASLLRVTAAARERAARALRSYTTCLDPKPTRYDKSIRKSSGGALPSILRWTDDLPPPRKTTHS